MGEEVLAFLDNLQAFVKTIQKAQTEENLDQAARLFADLMTSGVSIARAIFTRSRSQHESSSVFRAKAGKRPAARGGGGEAGGGSGGGGKRKPSGSVEPPKKPKGLGNPYKGKTLKEVQEGFEQQVKEGKLVRVYTDSVSGSVSYKNPTTGYSYNVDTGLSSKTGQRVEPPHVDVNYPNPKPKNVPPKRKFFLD